MNRLERASQDDVEEPPASKVEVAWGEAMSQKVSQPWNVVLTRFDRIFRWLFDIGQPPPMFTCQRCGEWRPQTNSSLYCSTCQV
jgi:hypothetical protein